MCQAGRAHPSGLKSFAASAETPEPEPLDVGVRALAARQRPQELTDLGRELEAMRGAG